MIHAGRISPRTQPPALGRDMMDSIRPSALDEDDSSLSSAGTELFDRSDNTSLQRESWKLDGNGKWAYGGSASSTGISSIGSSVAAEEIPVESSSCSPLSQKRMADGTFKSSLSRPHQTLEIATLPPAAAAPPPPILHPSPVPARKKRGRPPKNQSLPSERPSRLIAATFVSPKALKPPKSTKTLETQARPRSSIPSRMSVDLFASQCIEAALDSRLDPYALHPGEHRLLSSKLMSREVTVYLNIRNAILRLWTQNPLCSVSALEAAGCAKESRFFGLAKIAYKWLTRNGYINFGCVEVPAEPQLPQRSSKEAKQRTVVVIGAGVSGLTAARQLENLLKQEATKWVEIGEKVPRVIVVEGRKRIGGRVYSKPLRSQVKDSLPEGLRNTAEMGAMIVTGFRHGNPLDTIIRGQLGIRYHLMRDALTIYDRDGTAVEEERDMRNTELYTDISERAGEFRAESQKHDTLRGDEELINRCRDPAPDGFGTFQLEALPAAHVKAHQPAARRGRRRNAPPGTEKLTGRSQVVEEGGSATASASVAAKNMGWTLRDGVSKNHSVSLVGIAGASAFPTLGSVMDEAIRQYQGLVDLTPTDMRLLNWHHANLEYANAAPVSSLSLSGHDQDTGNEFEGAHSEIIGGYTQVPRGLMNLPSKLDVRFEKTVDSIHYDAADSNGEAGRTTKVVCSDGEVVEADQVVITAPLGVLKANTINFHPPLPEWKTGAIGRMGFGLLNKVILLYDQPFWDENRDMFGLLNEAERKSSMDPSDYARRRGRFYLIWNASKISGRPMLIALMAGNAAHDAEWTDTGTLMNEVSERLRATFRHTTVPSPQEVIVTRWRRDPFTRGTYSYVGPETRSGDYDLMAKPVGNLHFAGEATCGTHPATVHGAFLSGLRVASEVIDSMAGAIEIPNPLVEPVTVKHEPSQYLAREQQVSASSVVWNAHVESSGESTAQGLLQPEVPAIKQEEGVIQLTEIPVTAAVFTPVTPADARPAKSVCASDPSFWVRASYDASALDYEAAIVGEILCQIGERPVRPSRPGVNPFLLFTKAKWDECKLATPSAGRAAIRQTLGRRWKALSEADRHPYLLQSMTAQDDADALRREWEASVARWESEAARIRSQYTRDHPRRQHPDNGVSTRKTNVSNSVVLDHMS